MKHIKIKKNTKYLVLEKGKKYMITDIKMQLKQFISTK